MKESRTREFKTIRDKNLSQTFSQLSRSSNCDQSLYRETAFNQSSAPFQKKSKIPVCTNCVNKKIVNEKREITTKERQKELLEIQRQKAEYQNYRDKGQEMRAKFAKQAEIYNKKVAQRQLTSVQSAKQLDTVYMKEVCQREKEQAQLQQKLDSMRRQKEQQYRKQLKQQYDTEKTNKILERQAKLRQQPPKPLIKGYSSRHLRIKYAQELRKQIQKEKRRNEQRKLLQKEVDKMAINYAEDKFLDYSEFKAQRSAKLNPEIFQEMKELDQKRKRQQLQQRVSNQQERKKQQAKKQEEMTILAKKSMDATKAYAQALQNQIRSKQQEKSHQREVNQKFREDLPFVNTEEYATPQQACGQCEVYVQDRALSYY